MLDPLLGIASLIAVESQYIASHSRHHGRCELRSTTIPGFGDEPYQGSQVSSGSAATRLAVKDRDCNASMAAEESDRSRPRWKDWRCHQRVVVGMLA